MEDFVNLRVHSSYSIKDGLLSPKQIVDIAAKNGERAVAITDLNYMLKTVDFYEYARQKGVKPILGVDAYIERDIFNPEEFDDQDSFEPTRMLFLAKTEEGYKKLNQLLSKASIENQKEGLKGFEGVGFIKQSWLNEDSVKDIILLSGEANSSDIVKEALYGNKEVALEKVNFYKNIFGNNFFLEVQRFDQKNEYETIIQTLRLSAKSDVPVTATHPIQFENRGDYYYHELRSCISSKEEIEDINRELKFTREQYYKTNAEIKELFKDLPSVVSMSSNIANMCNAKLKLYNPDLPQYNTGEETEDNYLTQKSHEGLEKRFVKMFKGKTEEEKQKIRKIYTDRLNWELETINKMGFPGYFLIVQDYINYAKDNGIMVGPGRGSGAGSLVLYSLNITNLDPLLYSLLFERFLNPERVSMPDIDSDFDGAKRHQVINYVHDKYDDPKVGLSVSQIATYGLLKVKAVIKSTARVLGIPYPVVDQISKKIPNDPKLKLSDILGQEWLQKQMEQFSNIKGLIEACKKLENIPTSVGVHAGGVVVGKTKLTDYTPLARADLDGPIFSQYDKDEVEKAGLVKFDFLGLSNLTVLSQAIKYINKRDEFQNGCFELDDISLLDKDVFKLFKEGNSVAVFQFEGQGMRNTLKLIAPDRFEDLIAIVSLFRPGPMELIPDYARRKAGEEFEYAHPLLEDTLKETYGIMIYQEQVMQVAQKVAGYTLGVADELRRAMGKKKAYEMEKHRVIFREGAKKNGLTEQKADEIFDLMEKFANYGFNKSHAAAYALISYQTAYLKLHYTTEYYTAFLNVEVMEKASKNSEKVEILLNDARLNGLTILPPDINECDAKFTYKEKSIRYGLSGIKGVSPSSIDSIKQDLLDNGKYKSFEDFYDRIGISTKKTVMENLIFAGVFDNLEPDRAKLFNSLPEFIKYKDQVKKNIKKESDNELREKENQYLEDNKDSIENLNDLIKQIDVKKKEIVSYNKKINTDLREDEIEIIQDKIKEINEIVEKEEIEVLSKIKEFLPDYTPSKTGLKKIKPANLLKLNEVELPELSKNVEPWNEVTKFNYEKAVYGFYLTGHPYKFYDEEMNGFKATLPFEEIDLIDPPQEGDVRLISGIIHGIDKRKTKNGDPMWIVSLGNGSDLFSVFAFDYILEKQSEKFKVGELISLQVKIKPGRGDSVKNLVGIEDVFNYDEIKTKLTKGVNVALNSSDNESLIDIIKKHKGIMKVTIYNPEANTGNYAVVDLDEKEFGINGSPECIKELEDKFGKKSVILKIHEKMLFSNNYKYKLKH